MISRSLILILLVLLLLAAPVFAQITVSSQALPGTPGYLVTHFPQIFQAVNAAADGDTIAVAPGTYSGSMDLGTKNLRIYSLGGSSVTTINCAFATRGFLIGGGQTGATQISGFRILNGRGLPSGGGFLIENGSCPLLRDLVFDHCRGRDGAPAGGAAGGYGGGVHVRGGAAPRFEDCAFLNCRAGHAGGNHVNFIGPAGEGGAAAIQDNCRVEFRRCAFTGNEAGHGIRVCQLFSGTFPIFVTCAEHLPGEGGAIWALFNSDVVLEDCRFVANRGYGGGAIRARNACNLLIHRCVFEDNLSQAVIADLTPPRREGGAIRTAGDLDVRDSLFANNVAFQTEGGAVAFDAGATLNAARFRGCTFHQNFIVGQPRSQLAFIGPFGSPLQTNAYLEECLLAVEGPPSLHAGSEISGEPTSFALTFANCVAERPVAGGLAGSPGNDVVMAAIDFQQPLAGNYRLVAGSPFRDTALPARSAADASGGPRLRGAGLDLGAFEAVDPIGDLAGSPNTALFLHVGVNGFTAEQPRAHDLVEDDLLTIELIAGEGFLYGDAAYLAAEAQAVSQDPVAGPLRLALNAPFFLEEGTNQLAEASLIHAFLVPPGLDGLRLVLQGAAVAPDGTITFSDAQALHFRASAP